MARGPDDFQLQAEDGRRGVVSKTALAELFAVSTTTVDNWVRRGCPVERRGSQRREAAFVVAAVLAWREARVAEQADREHRDRAAVIDLERERALKTRAERRMAEWQLAQREGELVHVDDLATAVGQEYARVRARLEKIAAAGAKRLRSCRTPTEARKVLHEEVRQALRELSGDGAQGSNSRGR